MLWFFLSVDNMLMEDKLGVKDRWKFFLGGIILVDSIIFIKCQFYIQVVFDEIYLKEKNMDKLFIY